ncbi:subunit length determinant protein [Prauserella shujinwangii]|uniref:Subunit length determinant protein n=1 Tax=Prauserella shujinwangii TaxID=1453103 RepID=A0A2T0LQL4_9PSEU|nr:Wzz/FepE/Etk N-terminal domain-containing protein [Prauserella shujinwangii]PRX45638.1 subunit length determinant protein [Prauserella shujinwangii]
MTAHNVDSQPLIDLGRLAVAVRRRRRFWLSFGLLGLLLGGALAVLMPAPPTAVTQLLIVHEDDQPSDGGSLMRTDVALLQTTRIAKAALDELGSAERPERFLKTYEATGLTSNVLELKVEGSSPEDAVARAQALADVFVADHVRRVQAAADAEAQALRDQRTDLQQELAQLNGSIAEKEAEFGTGNAAELETLYARRAELASQISELGRRADEAGIGAPRVAAGTQIVDAPRPVPASLLSTGALNSAVGLVLGLAAGLALTAVSSVVRDRPVLRKDMSAHLGASVLAQLALPGRGPARLWRRARATAERQRVAATLARAIRTGQGPVSLLDLGCPKATAALSVDVARQLATDGPVTLVDDLPGTDLAALAGDDGTVRVRDGAAPAPRPGPRERLLGVGSVAPGTAWTDLPGLGAETVLVVRAGHASTSWLHTVARQLADARIPIVGVVLVEADPKDSSDGTLWDGLHTALRGRAGGDGQPRPPATDDTPTTQLAPVPNGNGKQSSGADLPTKRFAPIGKVKD